MVHILESLPPSWGDRDRVPGSWLWSGHHWEYLAMAGVGGAGRGSGKPQAAVRSLLLSASQLNKM